MSWFFNFLDWFVPQTYKRDRSDLGLARIFVFTHIFGPALGQSISVFLYRADPDPGLVCWIIIAAVCSFWLLPFLLKLTKSLQLVALLSLEILSFASLFGAYFYGGVSSPFLPWLIVALFIGFFYLSNRPKTLATMHGSTHHGDGARELRDLAGVMKEVLGPESQLLDSLKATV